MQPVIIKPLFYLIIKPLLTQLGGNLSGFGVEGIRCPVLKFKEKIRPRQQLKDFFFFKKKGLCHLPF
jgi:hypothetical protein